MTILDELNGDLKTARAEIPATETRPAPQIT